MRFAYCAPARFAHLPELRNRYEAIASIAESTGCGDNQSIVLGRLNCTLVFSISSSKSSPRLGLPVPPSPPVETSARREVFLRLGLGVETGSPLAEMIDDATG